MASLASEIEKLADLKAKGVLTEDEFTHAKAAVIAGDDAADSFEEAGADDDAVPVKSGIGYLTFWSEAFTLLEKIGNIPKDHNLGVEATSGMQQAVRRRVVAGRTHAQPTRRKSSSRPSCSESIGRCSHRHGGRQSLRGGARLELASARFWLVVVGWLAIVFSWIVIGAVYSSSSCSRPSPIQICPRSCGRRR